MRQQFKNQENMESDTFHVRLFTVVYSTTFIYFLYPYLMYIIYSATYHLLRKTVQLNLYIPETEKKHLSGNRETFLS